MLEDGQTTTLSLVDTFLVILINAARKISNIGKDIDILKELEAELQALTNTTFKHLLKGIESGFKNAVIDNEPSEVMLKNLKESIYIFSGFKSYQQLKAATALLLDNNKVKSFETYLKDIRQLNANYNEHYLKAEYNHTIASSEQAAIWADIEQDKDLFDLEFIAVNDDRTRKEHARLDGIVQPIDSEFWDKHYPPLGWGCRCSVKKVRKEEKEITDISKLDLPVAAPEFAANTAKEGVVFPAKHPYYSENEARKNEAKIKNIIGKPGKS